MQPKTVVFDLDDTLVPEIDYLISAFKEIALNIDPINKNLFDQMFQWYKNKENVFANLIAQYDQENVLKLKSSYRNHFPNFDSKSQNRDLLIELKNSGHFLGLITDGFSITQRHKIQALDIENLFDLIVISEEFGSEKPNLNNFEVFNQFKTSQYYYIGDNVSKDFITPNQLGWETICLLDAGKNIHQQDFNKDFIYLPHQKITKLTEIRNLINYK